MKLENNKQSGFAMVEVLAAIGIGGVLLAFMMAAIEYQNKGAQTITQNLDFKLAKVTIQNALAQPDMCRANFSKDNYFKNANGGVLKGTFDQNKLLTSLTIDGKGDESTIIKPTLEAVVFPLGITIDPITKNTLNPNNILLISAEVKGEGEEGKPVEVFPDSVYLYAPSRFNATQISIQKMILGGEGNYRSLSQDGKNVEIDLILKLKREAQALGIVEKDEIIKINAFLDENNEITNCYAQSADKGGGTGAGLSGFWKEFIENSEVQGIYYHKNLISGHETGKGFVGINTDHPEALLHVQGNENSNEETIRISTVNDQKALIGHEASLGYYNNKGKWKSGVDADGHYFIRKPGSEEPLLKGNEENGAIELGNEIKIGDTKDPNQECTTEYAGKIKYAKAENKFYFCDGTEWTEGQQDTSSIIGDFNGSDKLGNSEDGFNLHAVTCPAGSAATGVRIRKGTDIVLGSGQGIFTSVRGLQLFCKKLDPKTHLPYGKTYKTLLLGEKSGLNKLYEEARCSKDNVMVSMTVTSHTGGTARVHGLQIGCMDPTKNKIHRSRVLAGTARKHIFPDIARVLGIPSGKSDIYTCDQNSYIREIKFSTQHGLIDIGFASMFNLEVECW